MDILKLLRVKHWVKNIFVLLPLFFSGGFKNHHLIELSLSAFVLFCLAASFVYILNDIVDKNSDIKHPIKRMRPIAKGSISVPYAILIMTVIAILFSVIISTQLNLLPIIFIYILLNILYTYFLKKIPVIDIFIIAFGFLLRVYFGIVAIGCDISNWVMITTFSLALFLAAIKRKQELNNIGEKARTTLNQYTTELINFYINISGISAIIFYSLFSITVNESFFITIPIVILAFFRYLFLMEVYKKGESPVDILFEDKFFIILLSSWFVMSVLLLS